MGSPSGESAGASVGPDASRPDDNDRGGGREDKAEKADAFDHAMDNTKRPDRAPAPVGSATAPGDPGHTTDNIPDDNEDRGVFDRVADALSAPPTDAYGNARSTSPVADRISNTESYSLEEVGRYLGGIVTPDQSRALADGAAVMDVVVLEASYPRQAPPTPLSTLQGAAALGDAELAVSMEVYERETSARIAEIDDRIADIDDHGISPMDAPLAQERIDLASEREQLSLSLASPDAVERALRDGDEKIGLRADTLEKIVEGRTNLARQIESKEADLALAELYNIAPLAKDLLALQDDYRNMTDLGLAYQGLVDQEQKLADGETIYVSKETSRIVEELAAKALSFTIAPPSSKIHQIISRSARNPELIPEGEITITKRDDGVYEVKVPENRSPNGAWGSAINIYEVRKEKIVRTGQILDGGNAPRVVDLTLEETVDHLDLSGLTNGMLVLEDGVIQIAPDVRKTVQEVMSGSWPTP